MTLTVSLLDEPLTRPLLDGTVLPPGMTVSATAARSVDANSRAMQELAFDVAEMSFATYLRARLVDRATLIALPAFTGRRFVQPLMATAPDSSIRSPEDLRGRRVVVPQYWMTSSVWHRAILTDYYAIPPSTLTWVTTAGERFEFEPTGVRVERCRDGRTPADLVHSGEADAVLAPRPPAAGLRPLFADPVAEQLRYHRETGVLPIMHLVVLREELLVERPEQVAALWQALGAARRRALPGPPVPGLPESVSPAVFGGDPWSYGVGANKRTLETLFSRAHCEGLVHEPPRLCDVFAPAHLLT